MNSAFEQVAGHGVVMLGASHHDGPFQMTGQFVVMSERGNAEFLRDFRAGFGNGIHDTNQLDAGMALQQASMNSPEMSASDDCDP
jgi:hypothetical protein